MLPRRARSQRRRRARWSRTLSRRHAATGRQSEARRSRPALRVDQKLIRTAGAEARKDGGPVLLALALRDGEAMEASHCSQAAATMAGRELIRRHARCGAHDLDLIDERLDAGAGVKDVHDMVEPETLRLEQSQCRLRAGM